MITIKNFLLAAQQRVSLKTPTANENTYLRAGTAEQKPYSRTAKKILQKNMNIFYFPDTFHLYHEEKKIFIGDQSAEEHLKNPKLSTTLI